MKRKLITIILIVTVALAAVAVLPTNINGQSITVIKKYILYTGGFSLLALLLASYKTLTIDKKDILILIFAVLTFISTMLSTYTSISIFGEQGRYEGLIMIYIYIIVYLCAKKYMSENSVKIFANVMFYISMIIGTLGITQLYVVNLGTSPIFNKGISGTFGNSNFFGSYISLVLPIAIAIFIIRANIKGFILSNVMFWNMISSGTRSAWVAFAVVAILGLVYLITQKNKDYYKRTGILLVCFIVIFVLLFNGFGFRKGTKTTTNLKISQIGREIKDAAKTGDTSKMGSNRVEIWKMTLKLISKKPIFGCGTDNLKRGLLIYCTDDTMEFLNRTNAIADKAHNEYLQIAATLGVPALIVYLTFLGMILIPKLKLMFKNNAYLVIMLSIISYLVQAFFNISTIGIAPLFWMMLGICDNKNVVEKINNFL